jgi:hypothetical protein
MGFFAVLDRVEQFVELRLRVVDAYSSRGSSYPQGAVVDVTRSGETPG